MGAFHSSAIRLSLQHQQTQTMHSNKNITWYLHRATGIPHTAASHLFPYNTHICLSACTEDPKSHLAMISSGQYNSVLFRSQQKTVQNGSFQPHNNTFQTLLQWDQQGQMPAPPRVPLYWRLTFVYIYIHFPGRLKYSLFYTPIKMTNSLNTLCLQRPPGIKCTCSFFHEHSTRYYVRKKILAVYLGPK